jgi:murein L,D-transpeptidase YcbB/YkuD
MDGVRAGAAGMSRVHARAVLSCRALLSLLLLSLSAAAQSATGIESLIGAARLDSMRWPQFPAYQAELRALYAPSFAPLWLNGARPTPQAETLLGLFEDAWKKGLEPEDYDAGRWAERRAALDQGSGDAAAFDVALSVAAMRYLSDLRVGRVNPQHVLFDLPTQQKHLDVAQFLQERVLHSADIPAAIEAIEPPFGTYRRTEQALLRYTAMSHEGDGAKLAVPAKAVDPEQPYQEAPQLAQRLQFLGDLPPHADTAPADAALYTGELVEGVKRFQLRHGLDADGRLGPATVRELNVPIATRLKQLQLTLERWRWLPPRFSAPPIVVNIPDFRLRALDADNHIALEMRVVVGKAMRTETPVFSRDMTYVVFRPYWVVPPGIMKRTIIPALARDPDYVAKNSYEVTTRDGKAVTSGLVSDEVLAQIRAGRLMVRQKPGPKNALGLVKLIFPNEHSVYLHSTPSTQLFASSRRDFSSGCIRVEKPAELTAWVLRNNSGWPLERVQQAMDAGRDDVTVRLAQPVPVFIVYGTAVAHEDGVVHFYDDLYGHDRRLAQILAKGRPLDR